MTPELLQVPANDTSIRQGMVAYYPMHVNQPIELQRAGLFSQQNDRVSKQSFGVRQKSQLTGSQPSAITDAYLSTKDGHNSHLKNY